MCYCNDESTLKNPISRHLCFDCATYCLHFATEAKDKVRKADFSIPYDPHNVFRYLIMYRDWSKHARSVMIHYEIL